MSSEGPTEACARAASSPVLCSGTHTWALRGAEPALRRVQRETRSDASLTPSHRCTHGRSGASWTSRFPGRSPATRGPADVPHVLVLVWGAHTRAPRRSRRVREGTCEAKLLQVRMRVVLSFPTFEPGPRWVQGADDDTTGSACCSDPSQRDRRISLGRGLVPAAGPLGAAHPCPSILFCCGAGRGCPGCTVGLGVVSGPGSQRPDTPPPPILTPHPPFYLHSTPPSHISRPGIARPRPSLAPYPMRETWLPFPSVSWPLKDWHDRHIRPRAPPPR